MAGGATPILPPGVLRGSASVFRHLRRNTRLKLPPRAPHARRSWKPGGGAAKGDSAAVELRDGASNAGCQDRETRHGAYREITLSALHFQQLPRFVWNPQGVNAPSAARGRNRGHDLPIPGYATRQELKGASGVGEAPRAAGLTAQVIFPKQEDRGDRRRHRHRPAGNHRRRDPFGDPGGG